MKLTKSLADELNSVIIMNENVNENCLFIEKKLKWKLGITSTMKT